MRASRCHDGLVHYLVFAPHTMVASAACLVAPLAAVPSLRRRDLAGAVRITSGVLLVGATLAVLATTLIGTTSPSGQVNLVPGASIEAALSEADYRNAVENALGNVLLFVPLGFLAVLALRRGLATVTALAFGLSVLIEVSQLVLGHRWVDIDDVLLNTGGAFLGALATIAVTVRRAGPWPRRPG